MPSKSVVNILPSKDLDDSEGEGDNFADYDEPKNEPKPVLPPKNPLNHSKTAASSSNLLLDPVQLEIHQAIMSKSCSALPKKSQFEDQCVQQVRVTPPITEAHELEDYDEPINHSMAAAHEFEDYDQPIRHGTPMNH